MTTPDQIANLGYWYKADAITGLSNGSNLASWIDSSGNNNTLSQATAADQPTYDTNQINGLPAVQTDATDDYMSAPSSSTDQSEAWTFFMVVNPTASQASVAVEKWDTTYPTTYPLAVRIGNGGGNYQTFYIAYDGTHSASVSDQANSAGWRISAGDRGGGSLHAYLNGTLSGTATDTTVGATVNTARLSVFARGSGTVPMKGVLAEVIFYTRVLTSTERAQVDSYLSDKYGITVSDYVPSTTVPGAPTGVTAVAGDGDAIVSWTAPASNGGSPITSYTVTATPGGLTQSTANGSTTNLTFTGLTNGTAYTFTVHATNTVGNSAESSPSNSVTPEATQPASGTATLTLSGTTQAGATAAGTASLTVSATSAGSAPAAGTGLFSIAGNAGTTSPTSGAASITVTGTANSGGSEAASAAGTLSLTGSATVHVSAVASGSIGVSGTGIASTRAVGAADLQIAAQVQAAAVLAGLATINLSGSGAALLGSYANVVITISGTGPASGTWNRYDLIVGAPLPRMAVGPPTPRLTIGRPIPRLTVGQPA